jgi:isoquinoline 1-oxidoreductase subunit alpha
MQYRLEINDAVRHVDVPPEMPLLWVLRNELGLLGTKYGCGTGLCGACTVHVDGAALRSCQLPVGRIGGAKIHTIEHIGTSALGERLQHAWLEIDVMQCGYCQAGQIMSAHALLSRTAQPSDRQIDAIRIAAGIPQESSHVA